MSLDFRLHSGDAVVFDGSITHNLTDMAKELGIYNMLWRNSETSFSYGGTMVEALRNAIKQMLENEGYYKEFNPKNGWGTYVDFLEFLKNLLISCVIYPLSEVWSHG